jgi:hypothetical protein
MSKPATWSRVRQLVPWAWLTLSLGWAVVIIATDRLAWPLALWIATTVGPLTYLSRSPHQSRTKSRNTKGRYQ